MQPTIMTFKVTEQMRLDAFLTEQLQESRNQIASLIKNGHVKIGSKRHAKAGVKLKVGDEVVVTLPILEPKRAQKIDFDVPILYEDDDILVIDKPTALTVHPAPSVNEPTLVDWLRHHGVSLSTISAQERHGIVHRLDKGTSGVMVVAKNNRAHESLSLQLQDKSMGRYYLALITPPLKDNPTLIDKPIGRSPKNRLKMAIKEGAKESSTLFTKLLLSHDERREFIACKLFTGRTHQIRVHLESFSRHIFGDHLYGIKSNSDKIPRILLHAYILYLRHPSTGKTMRFKAELPSVMVEYLEQYFNTKDLDEILLPDNIYATFSNFHT